LSNSWRDNSGSNPVRTQFAISLLLAHQYKAAPARIRAEKLAEKLAGKLAGKLEGT
jgi:hypothetical protein